MTKSCLQRGHDLISAHGADIPLAGDEGRLPVTITVAALPTFSVAVQRDGWHIYQDS